MINVGLVGIGFMGWIHHLAYQRVRGVRVAAIASRDPAKRRGDWRGIRGNFGPPGERVDLAGVKAYASLDELLADPAIDLVDLCLPPDRHAEAAIAALEAGKHVFCEKPIALRATDADRMVRAAGKHRRLLLIGHVLPFFPEFQFAQQAIAGGKFGALRGAHFKRIISVPTWIPDFFDPASVGGPIIDLHIHDLHFIRLVCGMPSSVTSCGWLHPGSQVAEMASSQFGFAGRDLAITAASGVIAQGGRSFTHGFEIYLERATLTFDAAALGAEFVVSTPLTVLDQKGHVRRPKLKAGDPIEAFRAEISEVVRAVRQGEPSPLLSGELARDALRLGQRVTESLVRRRTVRV